MRYVLDTNVVVAAFRSAFGASRQLLLGALDGHFELLLSVPLTLEYEAVLTRPEQLAAMGGRRSEVLALLDDIVAVATPVRFSFRWRPALFDRGDDMVLETALNGAADAIVTFTLSDFVLVPERFHCAVLSPAQVLERLRRQEQ